MKNDVNIEPDTYSESEVLEGHRKIRHNQCTSSNVHSSKSASGNPKAYPGYIGGHGESLLALTFTVAVLTLDVLPFRTDSRKLGRTSREIAMSSWVERVI